MSGEIVNTHMQLVAAGGGVAIVPHSTPLDKRPSGWAVYRLDSKGTRLITDEKAAWYCYGQKVFSFFGYGNLAFGKEAALAAAQAWIAEEYGEHGPWKMNAWRDYVPERVQKQFPIKRGAKT